MLIIWIFKFYAISITYYYFIYWIVVCGILDVSDIIVVSLPLIGDAYGCIDKTSNSNPLNYDGGPITRSWAKKMKDAAKELVQKSLESMEQKRR